MGRVRSKFIKRSTRLALDEYPEKFSSDFNKNKAAMKGTVETFSKKIRNRLAGYITFIKKHGKSLNKVE